MRKSLVAIIIVVVLLSIAIPIILYLTYPVEADIVEQVMENVYENPPYLLPKFIPGVIGYSSPVDKESMYGGVFLRDERGFDVIIMDRGKRTPVIFLPRYICEDNKTFEVPKETLAKYLNNRQVLFKGLIFKTPKGVVFIPLEVKLNNISCVYIRRR